MTGCNFLPPLTPEFVRLERDRLTGSYLGIGSHREDYGWLQFEQKVPKSETLFYFETEIHSLGSKGTIMIGFANSLQERRKLGTNKGELGYSTGSRKLYLGHVTQLKWMPRMRNKDVIGCGLDTFNNQVFFTKNGSFIGKRGVNLPDGFLKNDLILTLCFHSANSCATISLGPEFDSCHRPLLFDIAAYKAKLHLLKPHLKPISISSMIENVIPAIRDHLAFSGYSDTVKRFDELLCSGSRDDVSRLINQAIDNTLDVRSKIRHLLLSNEIDLARKQIYKHFPVVKNGLHNGITVGDMVDEDEDEHNNEKVAAVEHINHWLSVLDLLKLAASFQQVDENKMDETYIGALLPVFSKINDPLLYKKFSFFICLDQEDFKHYEIQHFLSKKYRAGVARTINTALNQSSSRPRKTSALQELFHEFESLESARFAASGERGRKVTLWQLLDLEFVKS